MKIKRWMPIALSGALLVTVIGVTSFGQPAEPVKPTVQTAVKATADTPKKEQEMRGVWITYMELSMEYEADRSETAFREKFAHMAKNCADNGFNTLIVQVRPFADALYTSDLYPASHVLTGEQGLSPGYDALKIMCEICRANGLEIHAWVNPYRVTANDTPQELSDDNVFIQHPEWCIETDSGIILDPSNADARRLIENGVRELVENYDIDGVQFDDYFYPTDMGTLDSESYERYLETDSVSKMNLSKWRELNVNLLLSEVSMMIHHINNDVVFGISPQGNLGNNESLSADVVSWCCARGFADYICPQVYFSLNNPALSFEDALQDWTDLETAGSVKLYAGLAGYKAATEADEGTWLEGNDILEQEYLILKKNQKVSGFMLYSYTALENEDAATEIRHLVSSFD